MKRLFAIFLVFLIVAWSSAMLYADEGTRTQSSQAKTMSKTKASSGAQSKPQDITSYRLAVGEKAARGVKNILTGWMEIPKRIVDITKESKDPKNPTPGVIWGILAGTFQGTIKALVKTSSGAVDVVTAPITPEKDPFIPPDLPMS